MESIAKQEKNKMMNLENYYVYCGAKKGVTEHFPFDQDTLVFKVGGKMFALSSLKGWEEDNPTVNLKCDPEKGEELRNQFDDIIPGWHMSKVHWNTIAINKGVEDEMVKGLIDHSYDLVYKSLTKKVREELSKD